MGDDFGVVQKGPHIKAFVLSTGSIHRSRAQTKGITPRNGYHAKRRLHVHEYMKSDKLGTRWHSARAQTRVHIRSYQTLDQAQTDWLVVRQSCSWDT